MQKKLLIVAAVCLLLFGGIRLLLYKFEPIKEAELRMRAAVLPDLALRAPDGSRIVLAPGKPIVLVYFNSACDHCQRQLDALFAARATFKGITVVLMSAQTREELAFFAAAHPISSIFRVAQCLPEEIGAKLGVLSLPQIFVYDANGNLAGLFYEETDPKLLLGALGR